MPRNHLCPDNYVKFIKEYINSKLYENGYTKQDIFDYCVKNTEFMDPGDEKEIKRIVDIALRQFGTCIQKKQEKYFTVSLVDDIVVEDYPNFKMDFSESNMKALWKIEGKSMFDILSEKAKTDVKKLSGPELAKKQIEKELGRLLKKYTKIIVN